MNPEEPSKSADEKQKAYLKDVRSADWKRFLYEDNTVTRRAFLIWFSEVFLESPEGRSLPKEVQQQIYHISRPSIATSTTRGSLASAIINVLKVWEAVPLVPGTRQWEIARARFIALTLSTGLFQTRQEEGLVVTSSEMNEAQCWLHKQLDGTISMFKTVQQPWYHKDLKWSPMSPNQAAFETILEASNGTAERDIKAAEADVGNPEALRISSQTLQELIETPPRPSGSSIAASPQVGKRVEADDDSRKAPRISPQNLQGQREASVEEGESGTTRNDQVVQGIQGLSRVDNHHLAGCIPGKVQHGTSQQRHTAREQLQRDLDSEISVARAAKHQGQATAVPKTEAEDGNSVSGGVTLKCHSGTSTEVLMEPRDREEQHSERRGFPNSAGMKNTTDEASPPAQLLQPESEDEGRSPGISDDVLEISEGKDIADGRNDNDGGLLDSSQDEGDGFENHIKMDDTFWDSVSKHHERLHQGNIKHEGKSSNRHISGEHTADASDIHVPREKLEDDAGTSDNHLTSSPPGSVDWQHDHCYQQTVPSSSISGNPNYLDTPDSEATTEIEDNNDEDAVSGADIDDEADKENLPTSKAGNQLNNALDGTEGRLQLQLTDDPSYALSRDQWTPRQHMDAADDEEGHSL
ncbi:MAG: hypothetical protein Q9200_003019 [Gallowayella weberi]